MSFQSQAQLTDDVWWQARVRACAVQHAGTLAEGAPADHLAMASAVQRGEPDEVLALTRIIAAFPGLADGATPPGTPPGAPPDQSLISDADILAQVQANWPTVAALYYGPDGTPIDV